MCTLCTSNPRPSLAFARLRCCISPKPLLQAIALVVFKTKREAFCAVLCHPAALQASSAPPFCEGGIEKEKKECLLIFSRVHPKCAVALERMWDGFVASADDLSHVTQGVTNERALLFIRAVFAKALKAVHPPSPAVHPPSTASSSDASSSAPFKPPPPKPVTAASSISSASAPLHADGKRPSIVRGGGYGLDAAIGAKISAKYDADSEGKMISWIAGKQVRCVVLLLNA